MTPTAIIWDMGGILYRYFTESLLDMALSRGWRLDGVPLGPTGDAPDPAYEQMLRGGIEESEYLAAVRARLARAGHEIDPVAEIDWTDDELRPEVWGVVRAAHDAGLAQAVLTNDGSRWLGDDWWHAWPHRRWFDAMVDVVEVGVRKPAAEPYLAAADALGLAPDACLFVDDLPVNCAGAEAVGMASHVVDVRDPAGSMSRLAKRLELDVPRAG